ncbi:MAG: glycosyltransferase family 2 protein [Bacteroidetes bacterium]|nr:glycosyltransferase family 2 protein [Bacteroidota bacterium]
MAMPLVSVIIAVKDETTLLQRCLNSYLVQDYSNIEIIVVNDGSGKETHDILEGFIDNEKIQIYHFEDCQGQSAARNFGISHSSGVYIAIADADDFAYPKRISTQVKIFQNTADLDILGSHFTVDPGFKTWELFKDDASIRYQLLLNNPMVHSAVMIRKSAIRNSNLYRSEMDTAEDYDLYARMRYHWKFRNCKPKLVHYHIALKDEKAIEKQKNLARKIREQILNEFIPEAGDEAIALHHAFSELSKGPTLSELIEHIAIIGQGLNSKDLKKLNKILYTQIFLYCSKFQQKPAFAVRLNIIKKGYGNWITKAKRIYNWL